MAPTKGWSLGLNGGGTAAVVPPRCSKWPFSFVPSPLL